MYRSIFTILLVLIVDQVSKVYVKLNFELYERIPVIEGVFQLHFIENPGMAWGMSLPGVWGKISLTLFRVIAVIVIGFYLRRVIKEQQAKGFITCVSLVLAGAIGNIIDSAVYGQLFTRSTARKAAEFASEEAPGYAAFLQGKVVDMLHFCMEWPQWVPYFGARGGEIFPPIFNVADAAISVGIIWIIIRQKAYFKKESSQDHEEMEVSEIDATIPPENQASTEL
ncbi:MAG: lipoprotein signal peptidase [Flavobacteriales bacterium]|nr:lipoprotein signal peptidase [Flavobacteriales bacterium]MDG1766255.1 lipoprotein signal peptidase [Flavobacteriales bacterium]